jgi:hypothetical protein
LANLKLNKFVLGSVCSFVQIITGAQKTNYHSRSIQNIPTRTRQLNRNSKPQAPKIQQVALNQKKSREVRGTRNKFLAM